jgi:aspartokinase
MTKIRLGGIKVFDRCVPVSTLRQNGEISLADICSKLASQRINIILLSHVTASAGGNAHTSLCTEAPRKVLSTHPPKQATQKAVANFDKPADCAIVAVYPYDRRLDILGALLQLLARKRIRPLGLASSTAAVCVLVPAPDKTRLIDGLFEPFEFPAYAAPSEWHAAYIGKKQVLREIICSYEETIIKVYNIVRVLELELWRVALPISYLERFGSSLTELHDLGVTIPFLAAQFDGQSMLNFAFCLGGAHSQEATRIFADYLAELPLRRQVEVSAFFVHGPHFGDRYGIIHKLLNSLGHAAVTPLAVSCAVSSISVVVPAGDLTTAIQSLHDSFQIPGD